MQKDYYFTKIAGDKSNPKEAWKTINSLLGRQNKPRIVNELKLGESSLTNPKDIAEGFNDYFSNIAPNLASQINNSNLNFETYVKNTESEFTAFQPVTVNHVYQLLTALKKQSYRCRQNFFAKLLRLLHLLFQIH
ncbi:Hypothetical predicted protein [Paramuricea clavata]|uniref:Uncharacterized protein n=1 Tax=Paramuricea clavata TaxID=317549 RepID=A0A7D9DJG8_PARCT|nr:Hypothetical predicted protein [Paramuricea clavata]